MPFSHVKMKSRASAPGFFQLAFDLMLLLKEGFLDSSVGKESACNAGDPGSFLGREDPLEKG